MGGYLGQVQGHRSKVKVTRSEYTSSPFFARNNNLLSTPDMNGRPMTRVFFKAYAFSL